MTSGPIRAVDNTAPRVDGKFLRVDNRRFLLKGVAYGTFAPNGEGALGVTLAPHRDRELHQLVREAAVVTQPPPDGFGLLGEDHGTRILVLVEGDLG